MKQYTFIINRYDSEAPNLLNVSASSLYSALETLLGKKEKFKGSDIDTKGLLPELTELKDKSDISVADFIGEVNDEYATSIIPYENEESLLY